MVLVYFFVFILISSILILVFSTLRIEVKQLELSNEIDNAPFIQTCNLCIGIYLLKRIRILKKCVNRNDIEKMGKSDNMEKIKNKFLKQDGIKGKKVEIKERSKYNKADKAYTRTI